MQGGGQVGALVDAARRALALATELYGTRLTEPVIHARILLATGLAKEGQPAASIAELSALLADTTRLLGAQHPQVSLAARFLGTARLDAGDAPAAIDAFRISLAAAERHRLGGAYGLGMANYLLANALADAHLSDQALPHYESAARLFGEAGGPQAPLALRSRSAHALALARLGRLAEADLEFDVLSRAEIAGLEKATHAGRLAILRSLQQRHDEAIALARSSVEGVAAHPSELVRARADSALGTVLGAAGRSAEAVEPLQRAVRFYADKQLTMSPDRADAIAALARANAAVGAYESIEAKR